MADPLTSQLQEYSSCDVADALSKLSHPHGGFLEGLTMYSATFQSGPTRIIGPVWTVKFVPKSDVDAPKIKGHYVDQIPQGSVVFISQPPPHVNACYGGLMSLRAQTLGTAGVIVDGRVRDLQEHRDLGFPVFAKSIGTTAGGEVCCPSEVNVPVLLHSAIQTESTLINPGDFIIADLDGVVCIPASLLGRVLELVPSIVRKDRRCAEANKEGMSVEEAFRRYRG